jgi:hypothetical protein
MRLLSVCIFYIQKNNNKIQDINNNKIQNKCKIVAQFVIHRDLHRDSKLQLIITMISLIRDTYGDSYVSVVTEFARKKLQRHFRTTKPLMISYQRTRFSSE